MDLSPYGSRDFTVVGLPDAAVRESNHRVRGALKNCGYHCGESITVNLAPADGSVCGFSGRFCAIASPSSQRRRKTKYLGHRFTRGCGDFCGDYLPLPSVYRPLPRERA